MSGPLELHGDRVVLREAAPSDVDAFAEILAAPEVERWWGPHTREQVVEELFGDAETTAFAVVVDGAVSGLVTYSEEPDPDYRHAGIDIALRPSASGRGLGVDAVRTLARYLLEEHGHHRLTIDPAAANERAVRCYERVGFRPVGVMRRYERAADGNWRDACSWTCWSASSGEALGWRATAQTGSSSGSDWGPPLLLPASSVARDSARGGHAP